MTITKTKKKTPIKSKSKKVLLLENDNKQPLEENISDKKESNPKIITDYYIESYYYDLNWILIRRKIIKFTKLLKTVPHELKTIWFIYIFYFDFYVNNEVNVEALEFIKLNITREIMLSAIDIEKLKENLNG